MRAKSSCAVATCVMNSRIKKKNGITDISFHKFPKDPSIRKIWVYKCKRKDVWNPDRLCICSKHFKPEDFVRDLKAELMGYEPIRRLKPGSVPTLNLPTYLSADTPSALSRRRRMEEKLIKEDHPESKNKGG